MLLPLWNQLAALPARACITSTLEPACRRAESASWNQLAALPARACMTSTLEPACRRAESAPWNQLAAFHSKNTWQYSPDQVWTLDLPQFYIRPGLASLPSALTLYTIIFDLLFVITMHLIKLFFSCLAIGLPISSHAETRTMTADLSIPTDLEVQINFSPTARVWITKGEVRI